MTTLLQRIETNAAVTNHDRNLLLHDFRDRVRAKLSLSPRRKLRWRGPGTVIYYFICLTFWQEQSDRAQCGPIL